MVHKRKNGVSLLLIAGLQTHNKCCTSVIYPRMFLEPESEEHSYSPFVSLHLQVILISSYREIINRSGTGKLVAPRIDGRSPTRNDRRWK